MYGHIAVDSRGKGPGCCLKSKSQEGEKARDIKKIVTDKIRDKIRGMRKTMKHLYR
jgi:hypothetical protein